MKPTRNLFARLISLSAITLLGSHSAQATSAFWDGTGTNWATGTSWSTVSGATTPDLSNPNVPGSGDTATFSATTGNTAVTTTAVTINTILFDGAGVLAYTLGASPGTGQITLNDSGAIIINSAVVNNQVINANLVLGLTRVAANYSFTNNSTTSLLTLAGAVSGGATGGSAGAKVLTVGGAGNTLISGLVSNGGATSVALTKAGLGKLTLSNASSSYTGATTISAGTLAVGAAAPSGSAGALGNTTSAVVLGDAATTTNNSSASLLIEGAFNVGRDITIANQATAGTYTLGGNTAADSTFSGAIALNKNLTVTAVTGGTVNLTKSIANAGGTNTVTITGAGTSNVILNNATTNQFAPTLFSVTSGKLSLGASAQIADATNLTVAGGVFDTTASNFNDIVAAFTISSGSLNGGGTITATTYGLSGGTVNANLGNGTLNVTGTVALNGTSTASAVNVNSGSLTLGSANRLDNAAAVAVSGGALAIASFDDTVGAVSLTSGSITGSGGTLTGSSYAVQSGSISAKLGGAGVALTKTTTGTVSLSAANTYTGATTIKAGTLELLAGGSLASTSLIVGDTGSTGAILDAITSGLIVASGQTVSGIGTIKGSTTIQSSGAIAPGNSAGILTNLGNINLQAGSNFQMEINGPAVGSGYDQLSVTGSVSLLGLLSVTTGFTPTIGSLFFLIDNDGVDAVSGAFSNAPINGNTYTFGSQKYAISYFGNFTGNDLTNSFTGGNDVVLMAVPEPSAALLGGLGVLFLLRRRRGA